MIASVDVGSKKSWIEEPRFIVRGALIVRLGSLIGDLVLGFPDGARIVFIREKGVASGVRGKYAFSSSAKLSIIVQLRTHSY